VETWKRGNVEVEGKKTEKTLRTQKHWQNTIKQYNLNKCFFAVFKKIVPTEQQQKQKRTLETTGIIRNTNQVYPIDKC
jgi:hypothetical protein